MFTLSLDCENVAYTEDSEPLASLSGPSEEGYCNYRHVCQTPEDPEDPESEPWCCHEWEDEDESPSECPECDGTVIETTEDTSPVSWLNSASIHVREDSVQVSISVADPRGGFVMEIRRRGDGSFLLHVPHEGMGWAHMAVKKLHEGTFQLG